MKQITNISSSSLNDDYELKTSYRGEDYIIRHFGTDGDIKKAKQLLLKWNKKADVICMTGIQLPHGIGSKTITDRESQKLLALTQQLEIPVVTGEVLRKVTQEWALRYLQFQMNNYFTNARVLFFSGRANYNTAKVMSEYTDNLMFADSIIENGLPRILKSLSELKGYAGVVYNTLQKIPGRKYAAGKAESINDYMIKKAVDSAGFIVIPHFDFYTYLAKYTEGDLSGKVVITSTAYDDRVDLLKEMGVDAIIDTTPMLINQVVGVGVQEALLLASHKIPKSADMNDELLEIISEEKLSPRIIYRNENAKRVNRFAFIVYPSDKNQLKMFKPVEILSEISPATINTVEKAAAYSPPFIYSKVSGIQSPSGVEAEGWLIALGTTPEQMQAHPPEFTTKKIIAATNKAKKLGAQVVGFGMQPGLLEDNKTKILTHSELPMTTGKSYIISSALWAAAEAVRRMGLIKFNKNKILKAKALVLDATGNYGEICSRLLATAFDEIYLTSSNMAGLLTLQENILKERPDVKIIVSTSADNYLGDMDLIASTKYDPQNEIDIMQVKPGCVICDIAWPLSFSSEDIAKRHDVLVTTGGKIVLPGENIEMKDISMASNVTYAAMAETILLSLEGDYESFIKEPKTEWEKVKKIYKLGIKHGMELSAISGIDGVLTDNDIIRVKEFAQKSLEKR